MCPGRGGTTAGRAKTLDTRVGKTQRRCALLPDRYWLLHFLECSFADEAIMADALDVEQTSVGCKADLAQLSKILDTAADTKVACVVDGRFGSQCLQQLVILRSKIRLTWLGRPMSRFSRITSSKKIRPVTG